MKTALITILAGLALIWVAGLMLFPATWVGLASVVYGTLVVGCGLVYDIDLVEEGQPTITSWVCQQTWRIAACVSAAFVAFPVGFFVHFVF